MHVIALWNELNEALNHALNDPIVSRQDVADLHSLTQKCADKPSEPYALALAIARVHEARDSSLLLDGLNRRLLGWY